MNKSISNIDYERLFNLTGDPFVDCGGYVLKCYFKEFPEENILEALDKITKFYVRNWDGKLDIFFPNSIVAQHSSYFNSKKKVNDTILEFKNLIDEKKDYRTGICRISGIQAKLFPIGRHNSILSGSGTYVNFHHNFEKGFYVSKEVIIRLYFLPLGVIKLYNQIALIQSNDPKISDLFAKDNFYKNIKELGTKKNCEIIKSEFRNPANIIFDFADHCLSQLKIYADKKDIIINLYHFSNLGNLPGLSIYTLPARVFTFYKECIKNFKNDWRRFVQRHYTKTFISDRINYELVQYIDIENNDESSYRQFNNTVYHNLINDRSLLPLILSYSKKHLFNFKIVKLYQWMIKDMNEKTLNKIEELAEFIITDEDKLKKNLTRLNGIKRGFELRSFLLNLIKTNYEKGGERPLITLSEYVEYLFPDGSNWSEIRDLLIICIYQKMHEKNIKIESEPSEIEAVDEIQE